MRILDLFCCQGGASMGLYNACIKYGIEPYVCGVDIREKGSYPFDFIRQDVMTLDLEFIKSFDFIWASPPCQAYSLACVSSSKEYPDLVPAVRDLMYRVGLPFCIENVPGAPIRCDIMLCGEMFGLDVIRHRHFESSCFLMYQPAHKLHSGRVIDDQKVTVAGNGFSGSHDIERWKKSMGIDWITDRWSLAQAVPPVYSQYIMSCFLGQPDISLLCNELPPQDGFYQQERVLCGKPGCKCNNGFLHGPYWMRYNNGHKKYIGKSYHSYVPAGDCNLMYQPSVILCIR